MAYFGDDFTFTFTFINKFASVYENQPWWNLKDVDEMFNGFSNSVFFGGD